MSAEPTLSEFGNELPVGYRLEEFEIKSILGSGGFGITYLAQDVDLKREVVVKENLPFQCAMRDSTRSVRPRTSSVGDRDQFEWALQSFLREAETLSRFDHPNIVRVLRRFEANNTAYFVMPYLPGKSLKQVIEEQVARDEGFTEQRLKDLLYPLLDALELLHQQGVYHRDIKAANILLATGHRPILIDFGAARQVISEKSHTVVESAGYTPFEQLQSHGNIGPWSDIYALGGTFYTAIHGEPPPRASDRMRRDPIVCLADRYAGVYSRPFLEAIDWSLRVDEADRPQSVAEWRAALQSGTMPERLAANQRNVEGITGKRDGAKLTDPARRDGKPPATIPPLDHRKKEPAPFPFALVGTLVGSVLGATVLLLLAWHFLSPFFAPPGSLVVTAEPPNAVVKVTGQPEHSVPAEFPSLRVGDYQVTVSAPGYDPVTRAV
jgi:serine/threonine protein kinase